MSNLKNKLQQIKDDYVKDNFLASHELDTWLDFQNYFASRHPEWFEQHWEIICKRYAEEVLKEVHSELDKKLKGLNQLSLKEKGALKKSYEDSVTSFVLFKMKLKEINP